MPRTTYRFKIVKCGQCSEEFRALPGHKGKYCSRRCGIIAAMSAEQNGVCVLCGESYHKKTKGQRYCSERCQLAARKSDAPRTCHRCGKRVSDGKTVGFCSDECRREKYPITRSEKRQYRQTCNECGITYWSAAHQSLFCDQVCRNASAYRNRKARKIGDMGANMASVTPIGQKSEQWLRLQDALATNAENGLVDFEAWFIEDPPEEIKQDIQRALREATEAKRKDMEVARAITEAVTGGL